MSDLTTFLPFVVSLGVACGWLVGALSMYAMHRRQRRKDRLLYTIMTGRRWPSA